MCDVKNLTFFLPKPSHFIFLNYDDKQKFISRPDVHNLKTAPSFALLFCLLTWQAASLRPEKQFGCPFLILNDFRIDVLFINGLYFIYVLVL